jgi:hypothetical protein
MFASLIEEVTGVAVLLALTAVLSFLAYTIVMARAERLRRLHSSSASGAAVQPARVRSTSATVASRSGGGSWAEYE